jgi:hypothetical protein
MIGLGISTLGKQKDKQKPKKEEQVTEMNTLAAGAENAASPT